MQARKLESATTSDGHPMPAVRSCYQLNNSALRVALVVLALLFASPSPRAENLPGAVQPFQFSTDRTKVPDTFFHHQDGETRQLSDYRGQVILVNLWASWCPACLSEMASLERLQDSFGDQALAVLTLNQDLPEVSSVKALFAARNISGLPSHLDLNGQLGARFNQTLLPTTLLIDAEGRLIGQLIGPAEWDSPSAVALIRRYLP